MTPEEWIAHDPDPVTAAELAACDAGELAARFLNALRRRLQDADAIRGDILNG